MKLIEANYNNIINKNTLKTSCRIFSNHSLWNVENQLFTLSVLFSSRQILKLHQHGAELLSGNRTYKPLSLTGQ